MSFDEFKGWLRAYLELTDGIHEDHQARILEELEKVEDVEAAPVVIQPLCPPPAPWRPLGPYEVDPYPGRPYRLAPGARLQSIPAKILKIERAKGSMGTDSSVKFSRHLASANAISSNTSGE